MPQITINSANIDVFAFSVAFDIYNRKVRFTDLSSYNNISGAGSLYVKGISFQLKDQDGVLLTEFNFSDPQIKPQDSETYYELDLSSLAFPFLFQTYQIDGAIQDGNNNIYYTTSVYKKVCQPVNLNESGYVPGTFVVTPNCTDNVITVQEATPLVYNNLTPYSVSKTGSLYYPAGTISPVSFTGTPFSNTVIYTGQYRINCTTLGTYDLGEEVYVKVTYLTNNVFEVTCQNKIADLLCCMVDLQTTAIKQCNNAIGKNAQQQLAEISIPFLIGLTKEINGQDASTEAALIRKTLKCNCGVGSLQQNEFTPINPAVTSIVITGVGGTSIGAPTINGNTKTFVIASNSYQIAKGNTGDLAFSISTDTNTQYIVKYKITFNYEVMASYILTAIGNNSTLLNQLNSLISVTGGVNLNGLDGNCVIDMSRADYSLLMTGLSGSSLVASIVINGTLYPAPANTFASNPTAVMVWLNSLSLGTFSVVYNTGTFTVLSLNNNNVISTLSITVPSQTGLFQATNKTLIQVLQATLDYLCGLTALQVALNNNLTLCLFDYNADVVTIDYPAGTPQGNFNAGVASVICNIVSRINLLTGITCAKIAAIFGVYPNSFFGSGSSVYGSDGNNCVAWSNQQLALGMINAINSYPDVKNAFCAIDCSSPGVCPDISDISLAMAGANIGIYGLTWANTTTATQVVTVQYKLNSSSTWLTATSSLQILANGTLAGTTPFTIGSVAAGMTYDVRITNNCGGVGFSKQITVPTGTVYSGSFLLDSIIYNICGNVAVTLYSAAPFAPGVIMYSNSSLTSPVTGNNYIADVSGDIYEINTATGEVGVFTGSSCDNGVSGSYALDNSSGTICGADINTYYTNGVFAVGGTLYSDSGLTNPVTGKSYVLNTSNGHIYNLNSLTGAIGSDTGLTCGSYASKNVLSNSSVIICGSPFSAYYTPAAFATGLTLYLDSGLTTPVTGFTFVLHSLTGVVYNLNSITGIIGVSIGSCTPP